MCLSEWIIMACVRIGAEQFNATLKLGVEPPKATTKKKVTKKAPAKAADKPAAEGDAPKRRGRPPGSKNKPATGESPI